MAERRQGVVVSWAEPQSISSQPPRSRRAHDATECRAAGCERPHPNKRKRTSLAASLVGQHAHDEQLHVLAQREQVHPVQWQWKVHKEPLRSTAMFSMRA